jgi:hypothetical protein
LLRTILAQELLSQARNANQRFEARFVVTFNEASFIGFFPDRQAWT